MMCARSWPWADDVVCSLEAPGERENRPAGVNMALAGYVRPDVESLPLRFERLRPKGGHGRHCLTGRAMAPQRDLNVLLTEKVVLALPMYNDLLAKPFDPWDLVAMLENLLSAKGGPSPP